MEYNKSQYQSSLNNKNCSNTVFINTLGNVTSPYIDRVLSQNVFKCFCKKTCTAKKRLEMSRSTVYQKIKLVIALNYSYLNFKFIGLLCYILYLSLIIIGDLLKI